MCGRIIYPEARAIYEEMTQITRGVREMPAQINVPPTFGEIPVITDKEPDTLNYFHWSLIPFWSKERKVKFSTSNATIENLKVSGTWKHLIGRKHCIVITSGFYEWQYEDPIKKKGSKPHVIRARDTKLTLMAGLWDTWADRETGEIVPSCTIITMPANDFMKEIHNTKGRMPAFLTQETARIWTDSGLPLQDREQVLLPVENDFLIATPVKNVADLDEVSGALIC